MDYSQHTLSSTFAGRSMPTHGQNLQKSFQVPALEKRNFKKCSTVQVNVEIENKKEKKARKHNKELR